jgi:hypothetical protein
MKTSDPSLKSALMDALRGDTHQHFSLIWKFSEEQGFRGDGDRPPELVQLLQAHQERFIELLRKNVIALHWNDGDASAIVTAVPVNSTDKNKEFDRFAAEFPPWKPTLVN